MGIYLKEESSLPTVSIYAQMISCAIYAIKERMVITCDIPGALLQVDWLEDIDCCLMFEGAMVDVICNIDPKYRKYVLTNKRTRKRNIYSMFWPGLAFFTIIWGKKQKYTQNTGVIWHSL